MTGLATGNGLPSVVVTGVAMSTALATDADTTWKKLLDGRSGIRKLEDPFVEAYDLPVSIGGDLLEERPFRPGRDVRVAGAGAARRIEQRRGIAHRKGHGVLRGDAAQPLAGVRRHRVA